ncbi:MAG: hypothetical protein FGM33_00350 [Candidatus Kapabacteria bacterium]|nr:hypothetical protein [Candidatus Kapabacteria bacterium]
MDTKDPVWDDDEPGLVGDGFRPSQETSFPETEPPIAAEEQQSSVEAPASDTEQPEIGNVEPAETVQDEPSAASDSVPPVVSEIPKPQSGRARVESVSGLSNPVPGGGRSSSSTRRGGDRSSTGLVIIALLLFVISIISVSVYFFSRPAESGGQETVADQSATEQSDASGDAAQSSAGTSASSTSSDTSAQAPSEIADQSVPPPPAPAGANASKSSVPATSAVDASARESKPSRIASPKDLADRNAAPMDRVPPAAREQRQSQPPQEAVAPLKTSKSAGAAGAQWVVQVHSSPSIDDADEWLQKLQSRNIADGRIEPVTQKGSVWYRVRFGRYPTRQEAEQAALEMGYRNAWVDRIR